MFIASVERRKGDSGKRKRQEERRGAGSAPRCQTERASGQF